MVPCLNRDVLAFAGPFMYAQGALGNLAGACDMLQMAAPRKGRCQSIRLRREHGALLQAQDREQRRREQQQARAQAERELASERQKLEEAALPLMLDAMWAANVMDIQQTLKAVCHEVHGCMLRYAA